jgi:hypothetical protein
MISAAFVLQRAAFIACRYDRNAKDEVLFNLTSSFHLCGLIERAASIPKSGATHRRRWPSTVVQEAKAAFCRAHNVPHPSAWEWEARRTPGEVQEALTLAARHG